LFTFFLKLIILSTNIFISFEFKFSSLEIGIGLYSSHSSIGKLKTNLANLSKFKILSLVATVPILILGIPISFNKLIASTFFFKEKL